MVGSFEETSSNFNPKVTLEDAKYSNRIFEIVLDIEWRKRDWQSL